MTARLNSTRRPSTATVDGPTKQALAMKTSTPSLENRCTESCSLMPARSRRMRSIAAEKATWGSPGELDTEFAAVTRIIDGARRPDHSLRQHTADTQTIAAQAL